QQKLQLRPPIEEIRAKYYKEMRKLLSIPEKFKGVMEGEQMSKFFAAMLGKNADRFPSVYEKAEQLMRAVERVDEQFADWLVLAQRNFSEIRLECIVVSTAGAKSAIDELLQRLFDTLTWTLRLSINTKLQTIQQFLTQAISVLSSRPQSIDEVAEANARHTEYNRTNKELKASWAVLNEQHTLLRSVAGSGVEQMSSLTDQWEKFELMLDSHQMMIKEQVEVLKSNVDIRVKALNDEAEKLLARWNQFKPKSDALQGDRSKTYLFDELLQKWMEKLKAAQQTHMGVRLLKEIDTFREFSGCLKFCRGEVLSTDHWLEMFRLLHLPRGTTLEKLRFGDLIAVAPNVIANVDQLKALNAKAQGEVTIREAIQELEMWAAQAEFAFSDYKHSNGSNMKVIRDWKESINSVKDSQALLQSLKNSPFYAQFSDKTNVWETRLSDLDVYLPQMNDIQRKWIYLEPIFGRGALPAEASRFARVDSEFRLILADVVRDPRLISLCSRHSLRKSLEQIIDQLNRCQKALNQFLEEKRSAFPRFYFLGDDDLLEILGQSTNPTVIQSHLKKLFQGIDKVVFGSNNETISAMLSVQGEHVPLSRPVRVVPQVETLDGSKDFPKLKAALQEQLKVYTNTKVSDIVLDLKLKALILDLIHRIDVVDQLIASQARLVCSTWRGSSQCWTWQPMYMGLGGNPYGPAGTGKTESVKALASLFGRQVLVFNCDEGIDVHSMSSTNKQYIKLNSLQTVLSAVSMQIQTIQDVIKSKTRVLNCAINNYNYNYNTYLYRQAAVDPNAAIFITLNPAGKGYGGRQKMPDNLKQLFRPVVMSVPDNDVIAETILYSEGFTDAKNLARKIVTIFKLSKEMLSAQQHYDWGLRALKVVLRGCGDLRAAKPEADETETVVQALLLNTLSKLTFADSKRFNVLIDDVFSSVNKEMATFGDLVEPLKQASKEMNIELTSKQLQKVFQLYEQLRQRIGVVVVGPTGSGKSTIWRVLRRAQLLAGVALRTVSFNPKAMNRTKLLGHMDIDTREWSDGILTMAAREVIKDTSVHTWIIFDGDIDPEWIEALNSVLDDNRLLTMPSGERIQFGSNVNFLFETDSLQFASPATVSRMGMIFISEEDMSANEVVSQWIKSLSDDEHANLPDWIDQHFYRCYDWCISSGLVNGIGKVAAIHNGLSHLRGSKSKLQFLVALYRGLSSVIDSEKKKDFAVNIVFEDELKADTKPFILTAPAQSNTDTVLSWLSGFNRQPFVVVGPDGCGKEELLKHCFNEDNDSQLAIYGTNEMLAFLHQLLTYHGYYDDHLDWIGLENVQIVASMAPSATQSSIPPRLMSLMRAISIGYPTEQNLNAIYSAYLMPILEGPLGSSARVEAMASVMVRLYEEVRSNFRPADKGHYIFTPRDLTKWTLGTMRHELTDESKVIEVIAFESKRIFKDRLATEEHLVKFEELLAYVIPAAHRGGDLFYVTTGTVVPSHNIVGLPLVPHSKRDYQSLLQKAVNRYGMLVHEKIVESRERDAGVHKLTEAREQVAVMQKKAAKKSKLLAEKQAAADEALKDISKSMTGAEDQKMSMQQLRAATEEENAKIAEKKKHIEEQLKEEARSAVGSIKSESLSEIRSLRAPPEAIRDILQAVLLFMGILDTSWEAMRK
ncbi:dynein heavy chain, region 2, partial [Teladorsagia circumcincta]